MKGVTSNAWLVVDEHPERGACLDEGHWALPDVQRQEASPHRPAHPATRILDSHLIVHRSAAVPTTERKPSAHV